MLCNMKSFKRKSKFPKKFMCMMIKGRTFTQASKCIFVRYMGHHYWQNWLTRYCIARMNLYGALIIISLRINTLWSSFLPPGPTFLVHSEQLNSVMENVALDQKSIGTTPGGEGHVVFGSLASLFHVDYGI